MASSYSYDLRMKLFKAVDEGLSIVKACKIFIFTLNTFLICLTSIFLFYYSKTIIVCNES
ncbi:hypothetical protein OTUT144_0244 [Orientia tsutsugamushi str. UT144]|uniref:Uncharacterized protein n=1 Tax=Orientia tsutsugamushi str. UT144 TaxID=1441384 RepID=A0A0F3RN06_ORITS|nr:hypothetical protein OTUT144_0244 [Orientia tsutsugamushi str. UT144]